MESFHKAIGGRMMGRRPGQLDATQFTQGAEEVRFKLAPLVRRDGLWATEAGYPAGQQGVRHGVCRDILYGDGFRPARETIHCYQAVLESCGCRHGTNEVDVDVQETSCRQRKVAQGCDNMPGDFRALTGLAGTCPSPASLAVALIPG